MAGALSAIGADALAASRAPLASAVEAGRFVWLSPVVRLGATVATLGVLLSLMVGISRTVFSMASNGELPRWLSAVHPKFKVPHHAELAVAGIISVIVLLGDVRSAIGFSAFTILIYYAITNASALTLPKENLLWPRWVAAIGFIFCILLAASLPVSSLVLGSAVIALGVLVHFVRRNDNR